MGANFQQAINVGATGVTVTSGAATANVAIPNNNSGDRARVVRLASTGPVHVQFGDASVVATANDMLVNISEDVIVACKQFAKIAYIQEGSAFKLTITPLET